MKFNNDLFNKIEQEAGIKNMKSVERSLQVPRRDRGKSNATIDTHVKGSVYQADLLRLPEDKGFKYALVVVDTYDRSVDAEPMKSTKAVDTIRAIKKIFKRPYLKEPILMLQTDNGAEFKGDFKRYVEVELKVIHKYGKPYRSRQQAMAERMNHTISTAIGRYQLAMEMNSEQSSKEWIEYLPKIIKVLNENIVRPNPKALKNEGPTCRENKGDCELLSEGDKVKIILDKPIDITTGKRHADSNWRVTDARWSKKNHTIEQVILRSNQPPLYRVDGLKNTVYTRSQLQIVNENESKPIIPKEETYEVERILEKKKINNLIHYKIKWKNFPISKATYEPRKKLLKDLGKETLKELEDEFQG